MIDTNRNSVVNVDADENSGGEAVSVKDNVILVKPWDGNKDDRTLYDLIDALEGNLKVRWAIKQKLSLFIQGYGSLTSLTYDQF